MAKIKVIKKRVEELIPYSRNSRTHSDAQVAQIAASIREFGFMNPVLVDAENNIIAGHGRVLAARKLGLDEVPCVLHDHLTETQRKAYILADNKMALNAGWDEDMLRLELRELGDMGFNLEITGFGLEEAGTLLLEGEEEEGEEESHQTLSDRFGVPPFSVLNAREGWWQDRKKAWISKGIKSEDGRDDLLTYAASSQPPEILTIKTKYQKKLGREVSWKEFVESHPDLPYQKGTSVFDPVLCEVAYRWFSPQGGVVVDPFAGGSVRGIVASTLGRRYVGQDLSERQVEANRIQAESLVSSSDPSPTWIVGDSCDIDKTCEGVEADMLFTCPPYADLEVYSNDPKDLSNMKYEDFIDAYRTIIRKSCSLLKENRFAVIVVGEVRAKKGEYYNFVGDTIGAFISAGMKYYNEMILVTNVGSLAMRAGEGFTKSRKIGKTHQNVLVFVKGDPKLATANCGTCEFGDL